MRRRDALQLIGAGLPALAIGAAAGRAQSAETVEIPPLA